MGVVAHEVGHAAQDAEGYRLMRVRNTLASRLGRASQLSPLVFLGGVLLGSPLLMGLAVVILGGMALFSVVTLPVERDASQRALAMLEQTGLVSAEESNGVRRVLRAASLTYVTSLGRQVATFLLFVLVVVAGPEMF